jgi:glycerol uptake facilitator-like aquaporin
MINFVANFIHAFALHFFYSGAGLVGRMASGATVADWVAIATAFALVIVAMTYRIGPVSGSRVISAVTRTTPTRNN